MSTDFLSLDEYVQGSLTLAFTTISFILGSLMIYKYIKYKDIKLLLVGLSWILLTTPWWPDSISFILIFFAGGNKNYMLVDSLYFFIANALIAPIFFTWTNTFSKLVLKEKTRTKKAFIALCIIWAIIFEIIILTMFFLNYEIMGNRKGPFYVDWNPIIMFYLLSASLLFMITGLIFSAQTLKSHEPSIQLKGIFLMIAFITFTIGTIFDVLLIVPEIYQVSLILARVFEIIASIAFYIGFILPKFVKKLVLKT